MSGGGQTYNYPAQPTYGEGMADAMKAQMEMLTGGGDDFSKIYAEALPGVTDPALKDILRQFEAPLRKETAQIDTDVLRQTVLGKATTADAQGRVITGYEPAVAAGGGDALGGLQIVNLGYRPVKSGEDHPQKAPNGIPQYGLVNSDGR